MSLWVLDTDTLSLWLRGHEAIAAQVARTPPQQLAVTIITVEEILRGGIGSCALATGAPGQMTCALQQLSSNRRASW